jgi:hypothetical protein
MSPVYFTLSEATAALQIIRPCMAEIQAIRKGIVADRPGLWPELARAAGNGGSPRLRKLAREFERLDHLVHEILATGAEIKDLSMGLLDFRARRGGRDVYLCWKHGEDAISFWHEIDAGFAGRQRLDTF